MREGEVRVREGEVRVRGRRGEGEGKEMRRGVRGEVRVRKER